VGKLRVVSYHFRCLLSNLHEALRKLWGLTVPSSALRLFLVSALLLICSASLADTLIVQGSTTFGRRLMEPFKSEIEAKSGHVLTIIPNKSMPGLVALLEGRAHLAMISASLETERSCRKQCRRCNLTNCSRLRLPKRAWLLPSTRAIRC